MQLSLMLRKPARTFRGPQGQGHPGREGGSEVDIGDCARGHEKH
jgi:hypothetical protein